MWGGGGGGEGGADPDPDSRLTRQPQHLSVGCPADEEGVTRLVQASSRSQRGRGFQLNGAPDTNSPSFHMKRCPQPGCILKVHIDNVTEEIPKYTSRFVERKQSEVQRLYRTFGIEKRNGETSKQCIFDLKKAELLPHAMYIAARSSRGKDSTTAWILPMWVPSDPSLPLGDLGLLREQILSWLGHCKIAHTAAV